MSVKVTVDAMGGDYAPEEIVKGAVLAAREYKIPIQLVGKLEKIRAELGKYDIKGLEIELVRADEVIEMGESPSSALRKKRNSSIVIAVDQVAKGHSQALVAAGSTGAAMAASLFGLGRLPGIDRPAIGVLLPTMDKPVLMLDAGANSECEPEMLHQFAIMGSSFSSAVLGVENPRVGILNIGGESGKGNILAQKTYKILEEKQDHLNFIGNVEGREMYMGICDVVVCDGFVGNVTLKVTEGVAKMVFELFKSEINKSLLAKIGAFIAKPALKGMKKRTDADEYGGALLLGIKGTCVISHGSSKAFAIKNAIRLAKESVEKDVNGKISRLYELSKA
ncbi:MAG TPA: phosphate acyltransferase PlsX [Candidatus Gastranaerophilales bacterium]|nr:phosphate acyltransferase PlsX [Candidatus Gastranaerophilales bacterium]